MGPGSVSGISRRRAVLLPVSAVAAGGLGLAACTPARPSAAADGDVVAATSPSSSSSTAPSVSAVASPSASPGSTAAQVQPLQLTSSLGSAVHGIAFAAPLHLQLHGGSTGAQLATVTLSRSGTAVTGSFDAARRTWTASALVPSAAYTLTAVVSDGSARKSFKRAFTTAGPARTLTASVFPDSSSTVGVGIPVVVSFNHAVTDKAAVERVLKVSTTAPVVGAWHWFTDDSVTFRPKVYWPANSKVMVTAQLGGLDAGDGVWGTEDAGPVSFRTGDSIVNKVDLSADVLRVVINGQLARTIPVTGGKSGMNTRSGISVISQKYADIEMDSESVGYGKNSANYYDLMVHWAMRITNSGEFLHAAPWSEYAQGRENVSHGCVGMSTTDAYWLYQRTNIGDVVEISGTTRSLEQGNGWTDWNVSWHDWVAGSALHAPIST